MDRSSGFDFRNWRGIATFTALGVAACVGLSLLLNYLLLFSDRLDAFERGVFTAIAVPVLVGVPLFVALGMKLAEVRGLRQRLNRSAAYDPVTDCFRSGAFTGMVETRRKYVPAGPMGRGGAFLVVHVEGLMAVGARFGLSWRDEALRLIAGTIKNSVRRDDLVGRVGEADFGVFLAGASEQDAEEIGNRIVSAVSAVYFTPAERSEPLVVRVGGVLYERQVEFDALFRAAAGQVDLAGVGGASSFRLVPLAADISGDGARPTA
ncbi:MAG: diguanylate cyclase [Mesorhizobium sp.]|nr:diguanylate cyclase [Mesorhizobium sp.]MBN9241502.1 diguanylate cyclase [Mesorhizobium sp.]